MDEKRNNSTSATADVELLTNYTFPPKDYMLFFLSYYSPIIHFKPTLLHAIVNTIEIPIDNKNTIKLNKYGEILKA